MSTVRETIYLVRNGLRSVNLDDRISNRFIYQLLLKYTSLFIKRESDSRRIWKMTNLFQSLPGCIELEEAPLAEACPGLILPGCETVMKSKEPIPGSFQSIYGNFLTITTLDGMKKFEYKEPSVYGRVKKREFTAPSIGYYWLDEEYLIIPDGPEAVLVRGLFIKDLSQEQTSSTKGGSFPYGGCQGILDSQFIVPSYLEGDVVRQVLQDIRSITSTLQPDEQPDINTLSKGTPA